MNLKVSYLCAVQEMERSSESCKHGGNFFRARSFAAIQTPCAQLHWIKVLPPQSSKGCLEESTTMLSAVASPVEQLIGGTPTDDIGHVR
jgi:hypothetical protein